MAKKLRTFLKINRRFLIAVIALLEIAAIFCAVTFSWVEVHKSGTLDNNTSTVTAGDGLIFTDLNGAMISSLTLDTAQLSECSSVDGRNFFFPTSESVNSGSTQNMVYRAGTNADLKAGKYISVDFNVLSYSVAGLYIADTSTVTCDDENILHALRISLNFNDGSSPLVFCPALVNAGMKLDSEQPITSINATGAGASTVQQVVSIKDYIPTTINPIASFNAGESKRVTLSIWLEGTDSYASKITESSDITINLTLTSSAADTKAVTFVDYTPTKWVSNRPDGATQDVIIYAVDQATDIKYQMTKQADGITYIGAVPADTTDVYFARQDPLDPSADYNIWSQNDSDNMDSSDIDTFYAIGRGLGPDNNLDPANYGYWVKNAAPNLFEIILLDESNVLDDADTTDSHTPSLYMYGLKNYGFKNNDGFNHIAPWPGMHMEHIGTIGSTGARVYRLLIPADSETIQFNSGSDNAKSAVYSLVSVSANNKINRLQFKVYKEGTEYKVEKFDTALVYTPVS